ncbi:MAG: ABC transporter permease [Clostridium sp.]
MGKRKQVVLTFSILIILIMLIGVKFAPNDPKHVDLALRYIKPSADYPFGTDQLGRCILSRLLYGGRTTVSIVLISFIIIAIIGTPIGLIMGGTGKESIIADSLLNATTSIPPIAYLLIFVGAWGNGIITMLIAITTALLLRVIKLVKTRTVIEMEKAYVMCAITSGASKFTLLFRQVLPNVIENEIQFLCLSSADMILAISGFSFIGIGLGDNVIDWGMMVSEGREVVLSHPEIIIYPVVSIVICSFAFNCIARELERGKFHA